MLPTLAPILIAAAVSAAIGAGGAWAWQANKCGRLLTEQKLEQSRVYVRSLEVAHAETIRIQDVSKQAQANAAARQRKLVADNNAVRVIADGLREQLAQARIQLSTASLASSRQYAITTSELLDQCSRAYQGMAEKADGHVSDTLMLLEAWPK